MPARSFVFSCLFASAIPVLAQSPDTVPQKTTPLPRTTTLQKQVDPVGLTEAPPLGWHPDFIGSLRGDVDISVGTKIWFDRFKFQNFILSGTMDFLPGIRGRVQLHRREGETKLFQLDTDEIYLEGANQYRGRNFDFAAQLRVGYVRYLHFPYPDAISQFDLPPSLDDLYNLTETDYRTVIFQSEAALHSGWGGHISVLAQGFYDPSRPVARFIETYGFYRSDFGRGWRFEGRAGLLADRQYPVGRNARGGGSVYLGKQIGEFNVGLLYENKRSDGEYSGIMVQFRPGPVTRALGRYTVDYSRRPEGFTAQIPLYHGRINESRLVRPNDVLVGEVRAIRIRTVFLQGFQRNQYEHRLASWGETGDMKLHCVVTEEPWYLEAEALVSHHLVPDARWERDRMGPGQYVQRVTYRFYRPYQKPKNGKDA